MSNRIEITKGGSKLINVFMIRESTNEPLDLTTATQIEAIFRKSDRTLLTLNLTSGITRVNDVGGKFRVTLTPAQTLELEENERQDWEVAVTFSATEKYIRTFREGLDVGPRLS